MDAATAARRGGELVADGDGGAAVDAPGTSRVGLDEHAFEELYALCYRRLVGQVYAMCGDLAEAQDCVQEAFIRAWRHRRRLDLDRSPETWVRVTASRLAISRWRRARKALLDPDRALTGRNSAREPGIAHLALLEALAKLPLEQRRAIVLHHLCDLPVAEIAAETGAPVGTVKARLSRGRAALAVLLSDRLPEELTRG
ncbi:RNA polymerase sigma factor [Microlunatus capsulatus]|uniref:RNA polymerase sigma-70 factor (ECF subfamily) n=1 Tax=Microlunatus capsulatus TaxID=99117 RepID=A0ABS4Z2U0_9ACTN|nr:sigma-70 family RNA polymerase sigma factor [Microlunatus capsulatus]MBP2415311.1 RNA polymerase sigma-70 factor (ECF subfamily) [Microlunatus capsulatus]